MAVKVPPKPLRVIPQGTPPVAWQSRFHGDTGFASCQSHTRRKVPTTKEQNP